MAVHLITLYGVLEQGQPIERAIWLRTRPLRDGKTPKHSHFHWLTAPVFAGTLTVANIVQAPTPDGRAALAQKYVESVWSIWAVKQRATVEKRYQRYVLANQV